MDNAKLNLIANQLMERLPTDKDRQAVEKILDGAVRILYGTDAARKQTEDFIASAKSVDDLITGVMSALMLLYKKSDNTMPWGPAIAAGEIMLLEAMAEAAVKGRMQVDDQTIARATERFVEAILNKLGISTEQLIDVAHKAGALSQSGALAGAVDGGGTP